MSDQTRNVSPNKRLIGIVGTGNIANGTYLPYLSTRDDLRFAYFSLPAESAQKTAAKWGGTVCASIAELAAMNPETVLVLTNETTHIDVADELIKFGVKRIFTEKPLSARKKQNNVSEADFFEAADFLRRAAAAGASVAIDFNYRFFDITRQILDLAQKENWGELRESSWFVNYACWSHCIDLLACFGGAVRLVSALGEAKTDADIAGAFTLENGATGTILGTDAADFVHPLYSVTLNFERALVSFRDLDSELRICRRENGFEETRRVLSNGSRWDGYNRSFARSLAAYLESLKKNLPPPIPAMAGLRELQFEAALRRSAATGRRIDVPEEFPIDFQTV